MKRITTTLLALVAVLFTCQVSRADFLLDHFDQPPQYINAPPLFAPSSDFAAATGALGGARKIEAFNPTGQGLVEGEITRGQAYFSTSAGAFGSVTLTYDGTVTAGINYRGLAGVDLTQNGANNGLLTAITSYDLPGTVIVTVYRSQTDYAQAVVTLPALPPGVPYDLLNEFTPFSAFARTPTSASSVDQILHDVGAITVTVDSTVVAMDCALHSILATRQDQPTGCINGYAWYDANTNGIMDDINQARQVLAGANGVIVNLLHGDGTPVLDTNKSPVVAITATDSSSNPGFYIFPNLAPGDYMVEYVTPAGYTFTTQHTGTITNLDSDANPANGHTDSFSLAAGGSCLQMDVGLVVAPSVKSKSIAPGVSVNSPTVCASAVPVSLTATVADGTAPFHYSWSGPIGTGPFADAATISVSAAGMYIVTVTDTNNQTAVGAGTVVLNPSPVVSVSSAAVCAGSLPVNLAATVTSGTGPFHYIWTGPAGTGPFADAANISATAAGNYSVRVNDANGCTGTGSGTVTVNPVPVVSVNSAIVCDSVMPVSLTASVTSGKGPFHYSWTGPAGTGPFADAATISATAVGIYSVTVADANGCTGSGAGSVVVNPSPAVSVNSAIISAPTSSCGSYWSWCNPTPICSSGLQKTLTATVTSGTGPFHYTWTGPFGTGPFPDAATINVSVAGSYSVKVTDANGCTGSGSGTVTVKTPPVVNVNCTNVCATAMPVSLTATVTSGTGPFHYSWSGPCGTGPFADAATISATKAGTYTVKVTDANGSTASDAGTVTVNPVPTCNLSAPNSLPLANSTGNKLTACSGGASYTWQIVASTGTGWAITAGANTQTVTYTAGKSGTATFQLTVANDSGCTSTCQVTFGLACTTKPVCHGDTATIGFWHNKNGQALILALPNSPALGNWLASNFPYLYGANTSTANNLTGTSNTKVASYFLTLFNVTGTKTDAQVLAGALAAYVTSSTLAANGAAKYGFNVSTAGTGARTYNVGSYGTAIGLQNNASYTVLQLLQQANLMKQKGTFNANAFNVIFDGINTLGDII